MTRIKICGCTRVEDAVVAADAGADFIGMIFADSRRRVDVVEASQIAAAVGAPMRDVEQDAPPRARGQTGLDVASWFAQGAAALDRLLARKRPLVVGVFEDQPIEEVNDIADEVGLDLVQLSGHEAWNDCLLANRLAVKVVRPGNAGVATDPPIEAGSAVAVMLDGSRGTGTEAGRDVARQIASSMPLWLAGGLSPENVAAVIRDVRPWCVDVSTGVETDGWKDAAKIAFFARSAREAG